MRYTNKREMEILDVRNRNKLIKCKKKTRTEKDNEKILSLKIPKISKTCIHQKNTINFPVKPSFSKQF